MLAGVGFKSEIHHHLLLTAVQIISLHVFNLGNCNVVKKC